MTSKTPKGSSQYARFRLVLTRLHAEYDQAARSLPEFVSLLQAPGETHWTVCPNTHGNEAWYHEINTRAIPGVRVSYVPADCHIEDESGNVVKRGREYSEILLEQRRKSKVLDVLAAKYPLIERDFLVEFDQAAPLAKKIPHDTLRSISDLHLTRDNFMDLLHAGGGYRSANGIPQMLHSYGGILQPNVVMAIKALLSPDQCKNVACTMLNQKISPMSSLIASLLSEKSKQTPRTREATQEGPC